METKDENLGRLEQEVNKGLEGFKDLKNIVDTEGKLIDARIKEQVEQFLKEIKNNSLISVTVAPFSLFILQTHLEINLSCLIFSFILFMINALILNIGYWYYNNELSRSVASQQLEYLTMIVSEMDINNNSLNNGKRINALMDFFNSSSQLESKRKLEYYQYIKTINRIRLAGIILLGSAILFLIVSVSFPVFSKLS